MINRHLKIINKGVNPHLQNLTHPVKTFCWWSILFVYVLLIFKASSTPSSQLPPLPPGIDKIVHFCEYLILAFIIYNTLTSTFSIEILKNPYIISVLSSFFFALADELNQLYIKGRVFSFFDILADVAGILFITFLIKFKK